MLRPERRVWLGTNIAMAVSAILILMLVQWVAQDPIERLSTDWTAFDNAADRLANGETIYRPVDVETEPLPYLYPPFALWLVLPLGWVSFAGSFAISAAMTAITVVLGNVLLLKATPTVKGWGRAVMVASLSGATITASLIGQYSGILALAYGGAAFLWFKKRHFAAGLVLALLLLKPNFAIAVPVVLIWSRSWRALGGFAVGSVITLASSIPFGLQQWSDWIANVQDIARVQAENGVPFDKMVTVQGALQELFSLATDSPVLIAFWLANALVGGIAVLRIWTPAILERSPVLAFSALALFTVAANVRVYFYDATVIVLGLLGLWAVSQQSATPQIKRLVAKLLFLGWIVSFGGTFLVLNLAAGLLATTSLLVLAVISRGESFVHGSLTLVEDRDDEEVGVMEPASHVEAA